MQPNTTRKLLAMVLLAGSVALPEISCFACLSPGDDNYETRNNTMPDMGDMAGDMSMPDANFHPCLGAMQDMNVGPCLTPILPDMDDMGPDASDMPTDLGPCLTPALDMGPDAGDMNNSDAGDAGDMTGALTPEKHDLLAKLSDRLPPDVLKRLTS